MKKFKLQHKKKTHSSQKDKKRNVGIIGWSIIFIMLSSVIGFMWVGNTSEVEKYNNIKFTRQGQNWVAKIDGNRIPFEYFPTQVENIELNQEIKTLLKSKVMQFTYDPEQDFVQDIAQAEYMLIQNMKEINVYPVIGLKRENTYNIPVLNCDNATKEMPLIDFVVGGNETRVYNDNFCIIVEARNGREFIRAKDRILYELFGVING